MQFHPSRAIVLAAGFLLMAPCMAFAQNNNSGIQLLPPTFYGSSAPCMNGAPGNQVLFLGSTGQTAGQSAINCLTSNPLMINPANGFVGVDNTSPQTALDVGGPVRPVDTVTQCTNTTGGALRYNSGTNIFEGCENVGGAWQWTPLERGASCAVPNSGVPVPDSYLVAIAQGDPHCPTYTAAQCQNGTYVMAAGSGNGYPGTGVVINQTTPNLGGCQQGGTPIDAGGSP
jgi:hypothetical protein